MIKMKRKLMRDYSRLDLGNKIKSSRTKTFNPNDYLSIHQIINQKRLYEIVYDFPIYKKDFDIIGKMKENNKILIPFDGEGEGYFITLGRIDDIYFPEDNNIEIVPECLSELSELTELFIYKNNEYVIRTGLKP